MGCLLFHKWDGCKCKRCGATRDQDHDWTCCKCRRCGKTREHIWDGCKCTRCGTVRDENHNWAERKCQKCGKEKYQLLPNANNNIEGQKNRNKIKNKEGLHQKKVQMKDSDWIKYKDDILWLVMAYLEQLEGPTDSALLLDARVTRQVMNLLSSRSNEILQRIQQRGARNLVTELRQEFLKSGIMERSFQNMKLDGGQSTGRGFDYEILWLIVAIIQLFTMQIPRRFSHDYVDQVIKDGDSRMRNEVLTNIKTIGAFATFRTYYEQVMR